MLRKLDSSDKWRRLVTVHSASGIRVGIEAPPHWNSGNAQCMSNRSPPSARHQANAYCTKLRAKGVAWIA